MLFYDMTSRTHLPMSLTNWLMKLVSDWRIIPLSTASCNFSSKDERRSWSVFMRTRGRMVCRHIKKPRRMAPARTKSCGMRNRVIIHAAEMIAWWYSWRVENIYGGRESWEYVAFSSILITLTRNKRWIEHMRKREWRTNGIKRATRAVRK